MLEKEVPVLLYECDLSLTSRDITDLTLTSFLIYTPTKEA